ncbi:hypothetical protein [Nonomuraea typhae]|uniref:hypothetical protein n=1 Tax=Nonomuraea typhae TaxID=2603600 RepID=UPI0012F94FB3|nr:hypothetical protein [Nonomuraea typhae]
MCPTLPLDLLSRMARREAGALTLVPEPWARTGPEPGIAFAFVPCRWCAAPLGPIEEETRPRATGLPLLTLLRCEEPTSRSLLPLSLIRTAPACPRPRFRTRAAYWSRFIPAAWTSPDGIDHGLELLDAKESWFDAFRPGAVPWTLEEEVVLPASTGGLHFLTPHAAGPYAARLNDAYLFARITAVRAILGRHDHVAHAV